MQFEKIHFSARRASFATALLVALGAPMAIADIDVEEAEDEIREHPYISASIAASTAISLSQYFDDDNNFAQAQQFADTRFVAIRRDAATGSGENLQALGTLLHQGEAEGFGRWMQANYEQVFNGTGSNGLVDRIVALRGLES